MKFQKPQETTAKVTLLQKPRLATFRASGKGPTKQNLPYMGEPSLVLESGIQPRFHLSILVGNVVLSLPAPAVQREYNQRAGMARNWQEVMQLGCLSRAKETLCFIFSRKCSAYMTILFLIFFCSPLGFFRLQGQESLIIAQDDIPPF